MTTADADIHARQTRESAVHIRPVARSAADRFCRREADGNHLPSDFESVAPVSAAAVATIL